LDFLTRRNEKEIESFQLQILCQYVEENLVIAKNDVDISVNDLGNLEDIYQNYYDHQIAKISDQRERQKARRFVEEGLIFEEEERRLSMYEGQIRTQYGVSKTLLSELVNTHLLRAEASPSGGLSYEISHDTLVGPILRSKAKRVEKINKQKREEEYKRKNKKEIRTLLTRMAIAAILILLLMGVSWYINLNDNQKTLEIKNDELTAALAKLDSIKHTQIGAITAERDTLSKLYEELQDEVERLSKEKLEAPITDPSLVGVESEKLELQNRIAREQLKVKKLNQELKRLVSLANTQRTLHYKKIKGLNDRLAKEMYEYILKDPGYQKLTKDDSSILKTYQRYAEEIRAEMIQLDGAKFRQKAAEK